jgi:hypothetical protein
LQVQGVCGGIVDDESFECTMYSMKQEATELESVNAATVAIKLAKYGKE